MKKRNRYALLYLCLSLALSGCGTEEASPAPDPPQNPGAPPSCETLEPLVLQPPLTGGEFHCLWCNREWTWKVPADTESLFVLIALTCERLRSEAHLELRDPHASVLWQRQIGQGESEVYCIRQDQPMNGHFSLHLLGTRDLLLFGDLIEEYRGSIFMKVFNEQGDPVAGPDL